MMKNKSSAPCMMIGDFNEAMWSFEHFSQTRRKEKQMMDFREVPSQCDLHDLGFLGLPWTYSNKQEGERNVRVRLDRAVASPSWTDLFSDAQVVHLVSSRSDHCPLLLKAEVDTREREDLKGASDMKLCGNEWSPYRRSSNKHGIRSCRLIICRNSSIKSSQ